MVLPRVLGPWALGSVADCQTSDWACRKADTQRLPRPVGQDGRPPAVPVTCTGTAAAPARKRVGVYSLGIPAPFPASPGSGPSLPAIPSLPPRPPASPGPPSHPVAGVNPSEVRTSAASRIGQRRKDGSAVDGCL